MDGRKYALLLVAGALVLAACGEKANDAPTSPDFAGRPGGGCSFTNVSDLTKTEFGASSTEASWAIDMKNAGAGTDAATYKGYLILQSIEGKYEGQTSDNSLPTSNASQLTVALLQCMNVGGATVPSATTFQNALSYTGAYGVRGLGGALGESPDTRSLFSHDGAWLIEPPAGTDWQTITTSNTTIAADTLKDALLVFGQPVSSNGFTNDTQISNVFDWATVPTATFDGTGFTGVVVGECVHDANYLQHNPSTSAEVLGYIDPGCPTVAMAEPAPRTLAGRIIRFFSPTPLAAATALTTGTGGSKGSLSPFGVVFPGHTVLVPEFKWSKSGNTVNNYFNPTVTYNVTTSAGTPFLQSYILVWLEATNNQGTKVVLCNNWAYTDANGVASLPKAYLNKAGGYTITTKSAGALTITTANGIEVSVPTVPPSDPQNSPLINIKNDTSKNPPDACPSFDGDLTHPPEAPGPNGL